ncbi:MAG: serine/threonine-protein kinase [Acidobacteriota bacterium]|nr:serine/threonine-protein kinase [Acidobacteriota bacterium]
MPLSPGTKLGPYEVLSSIGAGGMGEVYRARDTRLDRTVAIKILPAHFSSDPIRRQRFDREAKAISGLNHPNICTLHDVGSQDGIDYLVMECVEGESLAQRLEKGPLSIDHALKIGYEIAAALDKAHRSGVIHRDLKPANIMLTKSGAKLLDFGLARPTTPSSTLATMSVATPQQLPVTQEGTIIGTFQYMSPEQIQGLELDARSDIFSFGAVLYEMLTGQRAFEGKSQLSVASAILEKDPPPITSLKPLTPANLDHTVKRCLAKDPDDRWQNARDLGNELKWNAESSSSQTARILPLPSTSKITPALPWLIATALALTLLASVIWWRNAKLPEQTTYFSAPLPFPARDIAVAPNAHTIAVIGYRESTRKNMLWIYELGSPDAAPLPETEGATYPFWSADGRSLGFFADGKLKKLEVAGGPVQTLADAPSGRGGAWNKDGVIIFAPSGQSGIGLFRISASGGAATEISPPDRTVEEDSHRWPMFLPDGKHYLYLAANVSGKSELDSIFIGSLDSSEKRFVVKATANAAYVAPGYLLFYRDKTLHAQRFDLKKFALSGEPTAILTGIQYLPRIARAIFAASDSGLLLAQNGSEMSLSQLLWFDRSGKEAGALGNPDVYSNPSLAPDGKFLAVNRTDIGSLNTDVWTFGLQRESSKRLTFDPAIDSIPVWSPDSARLVFSSNRQRAFDLFVKNADGSQEEKSIVHDAIDKFPDDWSRDGKYILYGRATDLWYVSLSDLKATLFLKAPSAIRNGQFSPDGKWIAYASNESGKWEIYVTSFPEPHGKWQVSTGGGEQPRWRSDGKELIYLSPDGKIMATPVTLAPNFDSGTPVTLFQATPVETVATSEQVTYGVSKDAQRFLINTQIKSATQPMSVMLNWPAKLNK